MATHISPDGKERPCNAKPGKCLYPAGKGGERPGNTAEGYLAAITEQLNNVPTSTSPGSTSPYLEPSTGAKYAILDLIDAADDEEALEELGFTMDDRDAAYNWMRDPNQVPENPQEAVALIEELLDVDYDEDELQIDPDARSEANAWVAETKKTFTTKS